VLILALLTWFALAFAQTRWPVETEDNKIWLDLAVSAPVCRSKTPVLTNKSIGPIFFDQSLQQLEQMCKNLRYGWYWNEGSPTPAALVRLGKVGLMIEFSGTTSSSTIYRIMSSDSQLRTADGFGPGSRLEAMIRVWGKPRFVVGECALYVWFSTRPGLSFRVDLPVNWDCLDSGRVEHTGNPNLVPRGTRVREVLMLPSTKAPFPPQPAS
jgi:hypothetical protein